MNKNQLTYEALQDEVKKELVGYTLLNGQGGVFVLLWSAGIGLLLFVADLPAIVLPWTAAIFALGFLSARDYLRSRPVLAVLLSRVVETRFPAQALADASLKDGIQKGKQVFVEIALKIAEIEREHEKQDPCLRQVVADAGGLIALQSESARQAEEFERVLRLVGAGPEQAWRNASASPGLRGENVEAVRVEAEKSRALAGDILQQMEILMLQLLQMERQTIDIVRTAEFALETEQLLGRMQLEVDSRRRAGQSVIELILPPAISPPS